MIYDKYSRSQISTCLNYCRAFESNNNIHLKLVADFFNAVKFADEDNTSTLNLMT